MSMKGIRQIHGLQYSPILKTMLGIKIQMNWNLLVSVNLQKNNDYIRSINYNLMCSFFFKILKINNDLIQRNRRVLRATFQQLKLLINSYKSVALRTQETFLKGTDRLSLKIILAINLITRLVIGFSGEQRNLSIMLSLICLLLLTQIYKQHL